MNDVSKDELRDLLLHRLPESRASALEERLMLEEDGAEQLQEATYDVLDDYAAGRLAPAERSAVERHLLQSEENRARLAVARGLARRRPAAASPPWRLGGIRWLQLRSWSGPGGALAAACAVLIAVVVTRQSTLHRAPAPSQPDVSRSAVGAMDRAARAAAPQTLTLLAGEARGAETRTTRIAPDANVVRVQAEVGSPASPASAAYRLVIADASGRVLFAAADLVPRRAGAYEYVEVEVPARDLAPGARRITVLPMPGSAAGPASGISPVPGAATWEVRGLIER